MIECHVHRYLFQFPNKRLGRFIGLTLFCLVIIVYIDIVYITNCAMCDDRPSDGLMSLGIERVQESYQQVKIIKHV